MSWIAPSTSSSTSSARRSKPMSVRKSQPIAVSSLPVTLPPPAPSLEAEVVRLRRMVQAMAQMMVECGVVDPSMVEGRLHHAAEAMAPALDGVSLKPASLWARLFGRQRGREKAARVDASGAVPTVMMPPGDQTVPVEKLPFEVQSLYDESGASKIGSAPKRPPTLEETKLGTCNRCWRHAPINSGSLCARCAVSHG
jgi:hypothetical protein